MGPNLATTACSRPAPALGLLTAGFFALLIVAQWMPKLLLNPCVGI